MHATFATRTLTLLVLIAGPILRPAIALAQETVPPDIVVTRHIGVQGVAIASVNWMSSSKSLKANGLSTTPLEIGGGVQVTNIWRDLFAQVNVGRLSTDGERTFVDEDGTSF